MVKPSKTAGKSQRQQIAMATTMKQRSRPGVAALKEIKKQQKSTKRCIAKSSFKSLVMDITSSILAERADTTGKRSTKNSRRNVATPSTPKSPKRVKSENVIKKEVKKEAKKETKSSVKKETKPRIKSEKR